MSRDWPHEADPAMPGGGAGIDPRRGDLVLARVESVADPEGMGRVEVNFPLHLVEDTMRARVWAPVATGFAGPGHGAFLLPGIGDVVVLGFLSRDTRSPVVLGAVWHGGATPVEKLPGDAVDRWVLTGRDGTRVAIVEGKGAPTIELSTPGGVRLTVTDEGGGQIEAKVGGTTLTLKPKEASLKSGSVSIDAGEFTLSAGSVSVNAAAANFSGVIIGSVVQTPTVVAGTYTTGAGNVL